jgi:hypothetical protein
MKTLISILLVALLLPSLSSGEERTKITFDAQGYARIDGKPFFPIGIWVYAVNPDVLADVKAHRFNTLIGNSVDVSHFELLRQYDLMAVPMVNEHNLEGARHPSLLAWYLADEPEGHGGSPEKMKEAHLQLKDKDPTHPAGLDHCSLDAYEKYKAACDFTMSDVYPVTKGRKFPMGHVGKYVEEARRVHGPNWPHWSFIQTFGGPESDGGIWAQPTPVEVRNMVYQAIVHRANGILYFSYWPQAPETWASITTINKELEQLVPSLLDEGGTEWPARATDPAIEVRARKTDAGWLVIAISTSRDAVKATITVEGLPSVELRAVDGDRVVRVDKGSISETFSPLDVKVYRAEPK